MDDALAVPVPHAVAIMLSPRILSFSPQVTVVVTGGQVRFVNELDTPIVVRMTPQSPEQLSLPLAAHGQATIRMLKPGLYHFYDALTAHARAVVAGDTVLAGNARDTVPRQGWLAVLGSIPGLQGQLVVPRDHDLFTPKVLVAVVGSTILVSNHDADAHNFVIDPASPAGAAFVVMGTTDEPPHGWQRSLVVQQPGLYHVYCTLHTRVIGQRDGWRVVVPRPMASGYADHDPMEAWIIVLPATSSL
jgi:plastocyanin